MISKTIFDLLLFFVIFNHGVFVLALVLVGGYMCVRGAFHLGSSFLDLLYALIHGCVLAVGWVLVSLFQMVVFVFVTIPLELMAANRVAKTQQAEIQRVTEADRKESQRLAEIRRVGEEARRRMDTLYNDYQSKLHHQ